MQPPGEACGPTREDNAGGERYQHTYYDDGWLAAQGLDIEPYTATLENFYETGTWVEPRDR